VDLKHETGPASQAIVVEALGDRGYRLRTFGREETDMLDEEEDTRTYTVVVNHEEQYSIWFANKEIPPGWREVGKQGTKPECLAYVEEVWTDMRPLSLRKSMAERGLG
jgi:MbtH protein